MSGRSLIESETQTKSLIFSLNMEKEPLKAAIHQCIEAIAKDPKNPSLYQELGELQRKCGDAVGASQSFRSARILRDHQLNGKKTKATIKSTVDNTDRYLNLLKQSLTYQLWDASDGSSHEMHVSKPLVSMVRMMKRTKKLFKPTSSEEREFGMDWPSKAYTMVGVERLNNIESCAKIVLQDGVKGDFIETGVWRGGCTIFMRAILKAFGDSKRSVWVADSFEGMPKPNSEDYPADKKFDLSMWKTLAVTSEEVRDNFKRFGLLDDQVKFLEGFFSKTLPTAPIDQLSIIRLDGDLYESTMDALTHLYGKLSDGGFVIVDDYHCAEPCKQAVDDFRKANKITEELVGVDWSAVYWRKERKGENNE
jgi:O-methyltransferase